MNEQEPRTKSPNEKRREVVADRRVQKQHKWKFGHDPADEDAHPDSGWEYATIVEDEEEPQGPPVTGTGGPEAGMSCLQDNCNAPLRIIQGYQPEEILGYLPETDLVIHKVEDRVMVLACSGAITHHVQMRESLLPIRTRLGL